MRVVALEEHYTVPKLVERIDPEAVRRRGYVSRTPPKTGHTPGELLADFGALRDKAMADAGVTVQVLSLNGPGPDLVPGAEGTALARAFNDHAAAFVAKQPQRFAAFATLPMQSPDAAAEELTRTVRQLKFVGAMISGTTSERFLDHPSYDGLLATAEQLDVPIYLHPSLAPAAVREIYYAGMPGNASSVLECAGWGWHSETAIHLLRLAVGGVLDRHPRLKLIIGHMGEMLPMMLARIDQVFQRDVGHLQRPISRAILDQTWITTSGIFTEPPMLAAMLTFGIDRIMYSVDYPYAAPKLGREFLDRVSLAPEDMAKLCHGTADKLLRLKA
jgi:hypothetical protein